jgi:uncharacterized protein
VKKVYILISLLFISTACKKTEEKKKKKPEPVKKVEVKAKISKSKIAKPYPLLGVEDKTSFAVFVNGKKLMVSQCNMKKDGSFEGKTTITFAGQKNEKSIKISSNKKGEWVKIVKTSKASSVEITRDKNKINIFNKTKKKKYNINSKDNHIIYEGNCLTFETFVLKQYDRKKGGKQKFTRFITGGKMMDMEYEFKKEITLLHKKKPQKYSIFVLNIKGVEIKMWVSNYKVYLAKVASQNAVFVREGYDFLNVEQKSKDPLLSKPIHKKIEKTTIQVPMRDKIELATDIYKPEGIKQKLPLILIRTPYKKELNELTASYYARRGYAVAIQDVRGRFGSKGKWVPFFNEAKDGYDAIEYLAKLPWCTGKVGMIGGSYVGWVQLWAATENPPHLTTIIPNVAPPGPFYNIPYEYGVFFIYGSIWWAQILESNATGDISGAKMTKINDKKYEKELLKLPVIDLDIVLLGKKNKYWRNWIKNNVNGKYWANANLKEKLKKVKIPVFLQSGWFDGDGIGSKLNYQSLKDGGNKNVKLILGPWGHSSKSSSTFKDHDFTKAAAPDLEVLYLRWFDYWLKGVKNKIMDEPKVQLFAMFSNKWVNGETYPVKKTKFTNIYLSSTKSAQTGKGDGKLLFEKPVVKDSFDSYVYDPQNPTPAPDFYFTDSDELKKEKEGKSIDLDKKKKKIKENHLKVSNERKDILVYETKVLEKPITIAGPISSVIYASTDAKDTDWFVSISSINAKGELFILARGKIRARYRKSTFKSVLLEKNKVYEYKIDMWQTGITFKKGEKIRVEITSAAFPLFSRNLNTGGHNEMDTKFQKANQKIYHSPKYPSHIILPVVE